MNDGVTSADSRRSSSVRYPFSASQLSPSPEGTLPPASFKSTEANRAMPGPAPPGAAGSGAGSAAAVSRTGSATAASGRRLTAGLGLSLGGFASGSAPGGLGGVLAQCVTSLRARPRGDGGGGWGARAPPPPRPAVPGRGGRASPPPPGPPRGSAQERWNPATTVPGSGPAARPAESRRHRDNSRSGESPNSTP